MAKTEKLIEIIKTFPVLYDFSHEDYKNNRKKDKIWEEIGKELNDTAEDLKKKWKNLRDTYAKYIRNSKNKTGQVGTGVKQWVWAEQMKDFLPFITFAKASSNLRDFETWMGSDYEKDVSQNPELECTDLPEPSTLLQDRSTTPSPISVTPRIKTGKRKRDNESSMQEILEYFKKKKETEHDAVDSLFLAYAKTIKKFSRKRQAITKFKIAQVIMEQEVFHLEEEEEEVQT